MAINIQTPPEESVEALKKGVQKYVRIKKEGRKALKSLKEDKEPSHLPHKIYTLGLDDIKAGKGLESTKLIGWRYILQGDGETAFAAEIEHDAKVNKHEFLGVNKGPFVEQTLSALNAVHQNKKVASDSFDLSVLRVPALYVMTLWLQHKDSKKDIMIPLPPVHHFLEAGKLYTIKEFTGILADAAKESATQLEPDRR